MDLSITPRLSPAELTRHLTTDPHTLISSFDDAQGAPHFIFLGKLWPESFWYMDAAELPDVDSYPSALTHPVLDLRGYLQDQQPSLMRVLHLKWVFDMLQAEPSSKGLRFEWDLMHEYLTQDLRQRTRGAISREYDARGVEHWRWLAPFRGERSPNPTINYLGQSGFPVYRALWPLERPGDPIPPHKQPVRDKQVCPDADYPCVRPSHFGVWYRNRLPTRWDRRGNGSVHWRRTTGLPSPTVGHKHSADGRRICNHGHLLSNHYQNLSDVEINRAVYCAGCNQERQYARQHPNREPTEQDRADLARLWAEHEARQQAQLGGSDGYASDLDRPI